MQQRTEAEAADIGTALEQCNRILQLCEDVVDQDIRCAEAICGRISLIRQALAAQCRVGPQCRETLDGIEAAANRLRHNHS